MNRSKSGLTRSKGYSFRYANSSNNDDKTMDRPKSVETENLDDEDVQNLLNQINMFDNDLNKFLYSIEHESDEKPGKTKNVEKDRKSLVKEALIPINNQVSGEEEATNLIAKWLESIGKELYIHEFLFNGFDDIRFFKSIIEKEDLDCLGIYNDAEINAIMEGVKMLSDPPEIDVDSKNEFNAKYMLKLCNLEGYEDIFISHSYDSFEALQDLNLLSLLVLLDIKPIGHRKRIIYYINKSAEILSREEEEKVSESVSFTEEVFPETNKIVFTSSKEKQSTPPQEEISPVPLKLSTGSQNKNLSILNSEENTPVFSDLSGNYEKELDKIIDTNIETPVSLENSNNPEEEISRRDVETPPQIDYDDILKTYKNKQGEKKPQSPLKLSDLIKKNKQSSRKYKSPMSKEIYDIYKKERKLAEEKENAISSENSEISLTDKIATEEEEISETDKLLAEQEEFKIPSDISDVSETNKKSDIEDENKISKDILKTGKKPMGDFETQISSENSFISIKDKKSASEANSMISSEFSNISDNPDVTEKKIEKISAKDEKPHEIPPPAPPEIRRRSKEESPSDILRTKSVQQPPAQTKTYASDLEIQKTQKKEEHNLEALKSPIDRKHVSQSVVFDSLKTYDTKEKKNRKSISSKIGSFFKKIKNKNSSMEVEQAQDDPNIFELDCPINLETKTTVAARMSAPWATKHKIQRVDSENATSLKNCDIWIHSPSQLMYGSVTVIAYFLGMYPVKNIKVKGRKLVEQPIQKLQVHTTGVEKMPEVVINISAFDIVCLSKQTNQKIVAHDVKTVFFCCQDLTDQRVFSLVYYEEHKKIFLCSVFRCSNVKTCTEAVLAIGLAFKLCSCM